ncbi:QRFP-like peptide receptor [Lingula anatina]|uniref:QRFP-like peptide receptor n=1 Tax=Lingula anatina TaxID=7574 RepID=A0A1S3J712_LINAN|nr:QRFP-like peptide receptor [Lingula anatina]|eukprot:XP_013406185.1 QRFP-like peptide receptor [Lingula anatina]
MGLTYLFENLTQLDADTRVQGAPIDITQVKNGLMGDSPTNVTYSPDQLSGDAYDYSIYYYSGVKKTVPVWEVTVKIIAYLCIIILSLVGNLLVIAVVLKNSRLRTTTNYYIVNLAVSDLMVTSTSTWVHLVENLTEGWVLGAFFCKFNTFAIELSLVSSVLTLTLIACDRFFGIVFAMKAHLMDRKALPFIIMIWVIAAGVSSPLLVYRKQFERQWKDHLEIWCDDNWPKVEMDMSANTTRWTQPSRTFYYTFVSVVLYFIPIGIMIVAYAMIIWKLWSSELPGEQIEYEIDAQNKIKKKVVIMLCVILLVYVICWTPFQILVLWYEYGKHKHLQNPPWYPKFEFFAQFISYSNSAFNPFIYAGFNENFRKGFKELLSCGTDATRIRRYPYSRQFSYRTSTTQSTLFQSSSNSNSTRHLDQQQQREREACLTTMTRV